MTFTYSREHDNGAVPMRYLNIITLLISVGGNCAVIYYIQSLTDETPQLIQVKLSYVDKYKYNLNLSAAITL